MARTPTFKGFPTGTTWKDSYGNSYEVSAMYSMAGHRHYHIKLNGKHIGEKAVPSSKRLIPETEVLAMKN